jgi:transcriptional regulator with XRE-family HTH domain
MVTARKGLSTAIGDRRRELGLSKAAVVRRADVSRPAWDDWETGARVPQDANYRKIEKALEWPRGTVAAYIAGEEPPSHGDVEVSSDRFVQIAPPSPGQRIGVMIRVAEGVERLSEADRRDIEEYIRFKVAQLSQDSDKPRSET